MIDFKVAAKAAAAKIGEDEDIVEVPIDGVTYQARRPTPAEVVLVQTSDNFGEAVFDFAEHLLGPQAAKHIKRLIRDRRIEFGDLWGGTEANPVGLLNAILAEFSGRPTEPSTDSSESQPTGGRRSTGRVRGKGSISSTSVSTDS